MPFEVPTRDQLALRAQAAFRAHLKGSDAALWPNNVNVVSKVLAEVGWQCLSYAEHIARQSRATTATDEGLERMAADFGLSRLPASYSSGAVTFTGVTGSTVPAGVAVVRSDGRRYTVTAAGTVAGEVVTVPVEAEDAGKAGNATAGVGVSLASPLSGVSIDGTVAAGGIGLGADTEGDEGLRSRLLFRLQNPPHGGAAHDYVIWAREVAGVTRVFVDPVTAGNGRTSVGIWFMMDDTYSNGVPQAADVAGVLAYLEALRPAGAVLSVAAPTAVPVDIAIGSLEVDSVATRNALHLELLDLFRRDAAVSTLTTPVTLHRSRIGEAISRATGEHHHSLVSPAADVVLSAGEIAVLGSITYA